MNGTRERHLRKGQSLEADEPKFCGSCGKPLDNSTYVVQTFDQFSGAMSEHREGPASCPSWDGSAKHDWWDLQDGIWHLDGSDAE